MTRVTRLCYISLGVKDVAAWVRFAGTIYGLQIALENEDGVLLRMDEAYYRLHLRKDERDDILALGLEVQNEAALDALSKQISQAGVAVNRGTPAEIEVRRVIGLIKFKDPAGNDLEAVYGFQRNFEQPFRPQRSISGFVTGSKGFGHLGINFSPAELEPCFHFYRDILGFRVTDFLRPSQPIDFRATFMHCNERHHSIVLVSDGRPAVSRRLNHVMLQAKALDDVGIAYDLAEKHGHEIVVTLGRHNNDNSVSFYMLSPAGFAMEYAWDCREIDVDNWHIERNDAFSIWGQKFLGKGLS